jgi:RHS repeat-associated protein
MELFIQETPQIIAEPTGTQYDRAGRVVATGILPDLEYNTLLAANNTTGATLSNATRHLFNALGQLEKTTDADTVVTLYAYNSKGERTITAVNLDNNAAITYGTDQITRTKTFATNRSGTSIPVIRTETHVWQDNAAENSPTLVSYNERTPNGLKSWSWQIGSGETSHVSTLGLARTETTTQPDSTWTRDTYSGGRLYTTISYNSGNTQITSLTYGHDTLNRPTTTLDSRTGITTTTAYLSATSDYVQSVSENSTPARVNSYAYDSRGRQTTHTLPDTTQSHSTYTPRGETEARWGSQTYPEFRTYDYAGRLKTLRTKPNFTQGVPVNAGGSITTWNYYSDTGLLDEKLDHDSKGPKYTYTAAGRLHTRQWARGRLTVYAYTHGRLTGVAYYGSDALWQDYLAARDAWLELLDNQQATQQEIDEAEDEMEAARTAHDTAPDTTTPNLVYTHDALGRMKTVTRGGNNHAVYEYNADLQLHTERLQRETIDKTITRTYQTATNVTNHTVAGRSNGYTFANGSATWNYNNAGRHHTLNDGTETFTYGYYNERVVDINSPSIWVWTYWDYVKNSPTYKSTAHGTSDEWYFDASAELNILGQREFGTSIVWQLQPDMQDFFTYYPVHFDDHSRSYDSYGQLDGSTNFNNSADDRTYTYDAIGNRLTATADTDTTSYWADSGATQAGANPLNQYVKTTYPSATSITSVHDLDGNLKTGPLPGAAALSPGVPIPSFGELTWDGENRLVKAVVNGTTVNYAYDHLSRLTSRSEGISPATSTHYLYDGWNRIAEYTYADSEYTLARTYLWGLDLSETPQGAGGVGGLLCIDSGNDARYYPAYDLNGNVIAYLDNSGQPAAHYQYDPFGNLTVDWESNAADFPYRFSTKPQDPITGLYYYTYRWLDPLTGRWKSRDPIGEEGGMNLYGFVGNDGVNVWDYLGLKITDENFEYVDTVNVSSAAPPTYPPNTSTLKVCELLATVRVYMQFTIPELEKQRDHYETQFKNMVEGYYNNLKYKCFPTDECVCEDGVNFRLEIIMLPRKHARTILGNNADVVVNVGDYFRSYALGGDVINLDSGSVTGINNKNVHKGKNYRQNVPAHEMGHLFGLGHPGDSTPDPNDHYSADPESLTGYGNTFRKHDMQSAFCDRLNRINGSKKYEPWTAK